MRDSEPDDPLDFLADFSRSMRGGISGVAAGPLFDGYTTEAYLGEGASATVWRARPQQGGPSVAIKRFHLGVRNEAVQQRLVREHELLARLDHPHIAKPLGWTLDETRSPCLVMELVEGDDLVNHCRERGLSPGDRLELFGQVCAALDYAHSKGVVHRDIKPSNILVTGGLTPSVKVIDFGIAAVVDSTVLSRSLRSTHRALVGTLEYMSPEQAESGDSVDARSDVYALGVLLFELLTDTLPIGIDELGDPSFEALVRGLRRTPPARFADRVEAAGLARQLPGYRSLDAVVMRALEKRPSRRHASAAELASDVARILGDETVPGLGLGWRLRRFVAQHRWAVRAAGVAVFLVGIAAVGRMTATPVEAASVGPGRAPEPGRVWEADDLRPWKRGRRVRGHREASERTTISGEIGRLDGGVMMLVVREVWHSTLHQRVFAPMKVYEFERLAEPTPDGKPRLRFRNSRPILVEENHTFDHRGVVTLDGDRLHGEITFSWRDHEGTDHVQPLHRIEIRVVDG